MEAETTWQRNAPSQIVLDSIFAALAAIWITFAIEDREIGNTLKFLEVVCSLLSFFFFAISAEGTTNAYDEKDVLKFVYYLLWYNFGVILVGGAIGILVLSHFDAHFLRRMGEILWYISPIKLEVCIRLGYLALFVMLLWRWIEDAVWLLCANAEEFEAYLCELDDRSPPEPNRHWLMRQVFRRRLRNEKTSA
ncbi:MAG TPA: hypothetical protein VKV03_18495 [Candidatus Binataceae bacterium]|nr:hypothetical protein [Candidatus Binataceae bacterium]